MLEPENLRVGYVHMVSGPIWMERFLGKTAAIDQLHRELIRRYHQDAEQQGLVLVGEPELTTEFDEKRHAVIVRLEGWGRHDA